MTTMEVGLFVFVAAIALSAIVILIGYTGRGELLCTSCGRRQTLPKWRDPYREISGHENVCATCLMWLARETETKEKKDGPTR